MVIGPLVVLAVGLLPPRRLRRIGLALVALGLVGLLVFLCWAALTWKPSYGPMTGRAFGLRFSYLLATGTDTPVVQCGLAGVGFLICYRRGARIRTADLGR